MEKQLYGFQKKSNKKYDKIKKEEGYIYLAKTQIGYNVMYKIGRTINLEKRLTQLNGCSPVRIKFEHTIKTNNTKMLENCFHKLFLRKNANKGTSDKISSKEWFKLTEKDIEFIKKFNIIECNYKHSDTISKLYFEYYKHGGNRKEKAYN